MTRKALVWLSMSCMVTLAANDMPAKSWHAGSSEQASAFSGSFGSEQLITSMAPCMESVILSA